MSVHPRQFISVVIFIAINITQRANVTPPRATNLPRGEVLALPAEPMDIGAFRDMPTGAANGKALLVRHRKMMITSIPLDQHLYVSIPQLLKSLRIPPYQVPSITLKSLFLLKKIGPLVVDARQGNVARWFWWDGTVSRRVRSFSADVASANTAPCISATPERVGVSSCEVAGVA